MFAGWILQDPPAPYESYGNGAAMRVSPAARLFRDSHLSTALAASDRVTEVTHSHEERIKGAQPYIPSGSPIKEMVPKSFVTRPRISTDMTWIAL